MTKTASAALALLLLAGTAVPASAHHSFSMFDRTREVEIKGSVTEFQFSAPHVWLWIMSPGPNGVATRWGFEGEAPSVLLRKGVKKNSLAVGDQVTVRTNPMKDGRPAGFLIMVTKADGTVLDPRNQAADTTR